MGGGKNLLKYGSILVIAVIVGFVVWRAGSGLVDMVRENGANEILIQSQEQTIQNLNDIIEAQKRLDAAREEIIAERDAELERLQRENEELTNNLPGNLDEQAPEALKELVRRLKERRQ